MTEQLDTIQQAEQRSGSEQDALAARRAGSAATQHLVEKVRDEAIDGIPVKRDPVDITMNLMRGNGSRHFTSRKH